MIKHLFAITIALQIYKKKKHVSIPENGVFFLTVFREVDL